VCVCVCVRVGGGGVPDGTDGTRSPSVQLLGSQFQLFQFQADVFRLFRVTFRLCHFLQTSATETAKYLITANLQNVKINENVTQNAADFFFGGG